MTENPTPPSRATWSGRPSQPTSTVAIGQSLFLIGNMGIDKPLPPSMKLSPEQRDEMLRTVGVEPTDR
ncbi:hypothetical protein [Streptomyces lasiicapitis]|uniref:Uncharacterized protein n=1 Tax=Streptomyces lasiicapitis TaxID=1923961 RepID=A0ABQ2MUJ5_9ACTN|nr:hypothetical protein [Streptomyces lasiicapitis]GGO58920.1 hypothetical protein GCM10012286_79330 [Streptomyces lasiicapitis]